MANNGKKEFPVNGMEEDCTSRWGKRFLCYIKNRKGIRSFAKNQMNRRFRKTHKLELIKYDYDPLGINEEF